MNKDNIINLSKLFIKENTAQFDIIKDRRLNKKSFLLWIIVVLFIGISWLSYQIINILIKTGQPEIFLNSYLLFLEVIFGIQAILLCTNVFYFSKDIEIILPLPFKPIEILIAKFNTLMAIIYGTELILGIVPFIIYGIYTNSSLFYYFNLIIILIIYPIFICLVISSIMIFLMKIIKLFKNKDLMQLIISSILIAGIVIFVNYAMNNIFQNNDLQIEDNKINLINEKIIAINKYFLNVNPTAEILQNSKVFLNYIKCIFINFCAIVFFAFFGNRFYLKQLLKNSFYIKSKTHKKIRYYRRFGYVRKEIKLIKNPLFFMQSVYPVLLITIMVVILMVVLVPKVTLILMQEEYKDTLQNLSFDFEAVCIIVGLIQIVGLFNYSSVTAFSREGNDIYIMKYLPVDFYKQFINKNIIQIFVNTFCSIIIILAIHIEIPVIQYNYLLIIFFISFLLFCINSFILCLVDLINPKINWSAEYELLKNNKNKLLQYVLIIINILFLVYFNKLLGKVELNNALLIFGIVICILFLEMNLIIFKYRNKLFSKFD